MNKKNLIPGTGSPFYSLIPFLPSPLLSLYSFGPLSYLICLLLFVLLNYLGALNLAILPPSYFQFSPFPRSFGSNQILCLILFVFLFFDSLKALSVQVWIRYHSLCFFLFIFICGFFAFFTSRSIGEIYRNKHFSSLEKLRYPPEINVSRVTLIIGDCHFFAWRANWNYAYRPFKLEYI